MYEIIFTDYFLKKWKKLSGKIKTQILKKLKELKYREDFKHLKHGTNYFVLKINQYRVCFKTEKDKRILFFVGKHKDYETFYKELF